MAVAFEAIGTADIGGTTSALPDYTGAVAAGDLVLLFVCNKPFGSTVTTPANFTAQGTITSGSVAGANGTGSVRSSAYSREAAGALSGTFTVSVTSGSPTLARTITFNKGGTESWDVRAVTGADTDETGTSITATATADPRLGVGDYIVVHVAIKDEAPNHTSQVVTVPGCTLGAVTWAKGTTTAGNDAGHYIGYAQVTAGTSEGFPTYTATSSVSGASSVAVHFVRVRAKPTTLTTTRMYFNNAVPEPANSWGASLHLPPVHSSWNELNQEFGGGTVFLSRLATASPATGVNVGVSGTALGKVVSNQFVSDALQAQTISGYMDLAIRCVGGADLATKNVVVRVITPTGAERGVLYDGHTSNGTSTEQTVNRYLANNVSILAETALTPVVCQVGDRIVVEMGIRLESATGPTWPNVFYGIAGADAALDTTAGSGFTPWIDFKTPAAIAIQPWTEAVAGVAAGTVDAAGHSVATKVTAGCATATAVAHAARPVTTWFNTAEGGTDGTNATTGNTGGASGDAFDAVALAGTGDIEFDDAFSARGRLAYWLRSGTSGTMSLQHAFTVAAPEYHRFYVRFPTGMDSSQGPFISASTAGAWVLQYSPLGHRLVVTGTGGSASTPAESVPLDQWVRVELKLHGDGNLTIRLFSGANVHGQTPDYEDTPAGINYGSTSGTVRYGIVAARSNWSYWLDEIASSNIDWIGSAPMVADVATASAAAQNATVTAIAGGTSVNAGLAAAVAAAQAPTVKVAPAVQAASATAAGQNATIVRAGNPLAQTAMASALAQDPTVTRTGRADAQVASAVGAAGAVQARVAPTAGIALATAAGQDATVTRSAFAPAQVATASALAQAATGARAGNPLSQAATASALAQGSQVAIAPTASAASAAALAQQASVSLAGSTNAFAQVAAAAAAALGSQVAVAPTSQVAAVSATAQAATVARAGNPLAAPAQATASALGVTSKVAPTAQVAAATAAAQAATAVTSGNTSALAQAALASGAAGALTAKVAPQVSAATATAQALAASSSVGASPQTALATAAAQPATTRINVSAAPALATGAAQPATISTASQVFASAGAATASAAALAPTATRSDNISVTPTTAQAVATAQTATTRSSGNATPTAALAAAAAQPATISTASQTFVSAGAATASAAALGATASRSDNIAVSPASALAAAVAQPATTRSSGNATPTAATAMALAQAATVSTATSALAGCALASAVAHGVSASVATSAGAAQASVIALPPHVTIDLRPGTAGGLALANAPSTGVSPTAGFADPSALALTPVVVAHDVILVPAGVAQAAALALSPEALTATFPRVEAPGIAVDNQPRGVSLGPPDRTVDVEQPRNVALGEE